MAELSRDHPGKVESGRGLARDDIVIAVPGKGTARDDEPSG